MSKALRREALALVLLLAAWEVALGYLRSPRALRTFAVGPTVADLSALAGDKPRRGDGSLHLPATPEPPSTVGLSGLELRPETRYLVSIRADAGGRFSLRLIDRDGQKTAARIQVPRRGETERFLVPLDLDRAPASNRLEIWNETATDLVIDELRFHERRAGFDTVRAVVRLAGPLALVLFGLRRRRSLIEYVRAGPDQSIPRTRVWDRALAFIFFLACFHVFFSAPVEQILDSKFNTVVSYRLVTAGTLTLPERFDEIESLPYQLQRIDDRVYHFYPNAVAVLNAPFVALFDRLGAPPLGSDGSFLRHRENRILAFAAAIQAAALCGVLFVLARLFLRPVPALAMAALFAFGTPIFSSVSRPYWSHSWALLLMAAAIYPLISPLLRERTSSYVVSASLLSWSFFCRPPMSLSILGVVAYLAFTRRKRLPWFAVTGLVWGALFVAYSLRTFHSLVPPYFLTSHLQSGVLGVDTLQRSYPQALVGTLFSPGRGLFVYVPFLVVVLILGVRYRRELTNRGLVLTALAVSLAHWQLLSANRSWWGGQSFGPRLFSDILVWIFLLTILVALAWGRRWSGLGGGRRSIQIAAIVLLVGASIFINFRGGAARETYRWRGYSLWDWRHPQFMAGLFPAPADRPLAARIVDLETQRDAGERRLVLETILEDDSVEKRLIAGPDMIATGVTWDKWTQGERPGALVVRNRGDEPWSPGLGLAVWAAAGEYPITILVDDGETVHRFGFESKGIRRIELPPVPAGSERLFVIRSDKGWSPGGRDSRVLGVQLLPPG